MPTKTALLFHVKHLSQSKGSGKGQQYGRYGHKGAEKEVAHVLMAKGGDNGAEKVGRQGDAGDKLGHKASYFRANPASPVEHNTHKADKQQTENAAQGVQVFHTCFDERMSAASFLAAD